MIPFHKQTDKRKLAGQVVNPIPEQYLHQYIAKKEDNTKRITFDEWYHQRYTEVDDVNFIHDAREVWNAALTKGKL